VLLRARKARQSSVHQVLRKAPLGTTSHHYTPLVALEASFDRGDCIATLYEHLFEYAAFRGFSTL